MTSSPMKEEIAASAGIPPNRLIAISPAVANPVPGTPSATPDTQRPRHLRPEGDDPDARVRPGADHLASRRRRPEPEQATKLADAAFKVLNKHLDSVGGHGQGARLAAHHRPPARPGPRRGPDARSRQVHGGDRRLVVFGAGCGTILLLVALARGWRAASEIERDAAAAASQSTATLTDTSMATATGTATSRRNRPSCRRRPPCRPSSPRACPRRRLTSAPKRNWASR